MVDWDEIYARLSGLPMHVRSTDRTLIWRAEVAFRRQVERSRRAVVVRCAPERRVRGMYRRVFGAQVIVLEVPEEECLRRLYASDRPPATLDATAAAIRDWWRRYEPSPKDRVEVPA